MDKFVGILLGIVVLGISVIVHELGHFLFAKINRIGVEEFAIGMGPKIFKKRIGETEFSLRAFPIGGLCKMLGEDEAVDGDKSFSSKSVWARVQVILAGAFFNFLLAFIASIIFVSANSWIVTTTVDRIVAESPAARSDLRVGDQIVEINGKHVIAYDEIPIYIEEGKGREIELVVKRDGEKITKNITPYLSEDGSYKVGFGPKYIEDLNPLQTVKYAAIDTVKWIKLVFYSLGKLVTGVYRLDDVSGPIGFFAETGDTYEQVADDGNSVLRLFLLLVVFLGANLGVMNLLPIPALDGGRFIFLLLEAVRGKPIDQDKEAFVHFMGFVLLMVLMAVIMFNDFKKYF